MPINKAMCGPAIVLAVTSASAGLNANLVVRAVEIDLASTKPSLAKYTLLFANDWADDLAIKLQPAYPRMRGCRSNRRP
jgi:hypothetical protein